MDEEVASNQRDITLFPAFPYEINNYLPIFGYKISRQIGYLEQSSIFSKTRKS